MNEDEPDIVRPVLSRRLRWRDDAGVWHEGPPPVTKKATPAPTITREAPPPSIPSEPQRPYVPPAEKPKPVEYPVVPAVFAHDDRTRLRVQAMEFALALARLEQKPATGPDLIASAEIVERWIASAKL